MGSVHPFARQRSFDPETLQVMGVALDCAWYQLMISGSALTASFRLEHTREALASCIITKAQLGERDVNRLRDYAVAHVKELLEVEPWGAPTETLRVPLNQSDRRRSVAGALTLLCQ
jgi:hypothetical protein